MPHSRALSPRSLPGSPGFAETLRRPRGGALMRRAIRWAAVGGLMLAAALVAANTLRMVVDCAVPVTILDQWAQLVGARTVTLSWLFSQHNEHRLLFPRLVFVADRYLFAETGVLSLAVSVALQGGLVLLLLHLGRAAGIKSGMATAVAASGVVALLAWAVQYENYTWPFQVQFFGVLLAAACCFAAVAMLRPGVWSAILVIGCGFVASFTLSSGIAAPFLAAALALWLRRPGRYCAALTLAAIAMLGGYLIGYHTPPEHSDPLLAVQHPLAVLRYAAAVLGSPFASAISAVTGVTSPMSSQIIGLGGLVLLAALTMPMLRRRQPAPPAAAALLALCGFVLATAALTALGRLRFGPASALVSRYTTPVLALWACILLLGMIRLQRPAWAGFGVALLLAFVGWTQPAFVHDAALLAADRSIAMPALVAGVADAKVIAPVYDNPAVPLQVRLTQFATRTGVFSQPWAPWIGTALQDHARVADPARCQGSFDAAVRIGDAAYPGWRVQGDLQWPRAKRRRQVIALVDGGGQIVGFGISDFDATTLKVAGPAGETSRTGWVGAITGPDPAAVQAYVLLDGFGAACKLHNAPQVETAVQVAVSGPAPIGATAAGSVDAVYMDQYVTIDGWGLVQTASGTPRIALDTNLPVRSATIAAVARPDAASALKDPRLAKAGFRVVLTLDPGQAMPASPRLCLWSQDQVYGAHRLTMNPATDAQRQLCPG